MTGFGARTLGSDEPKYLNSPQTSLFDKSATLYALNLARTAIRQVNLAVLVEGYMDAIAAHQAGFTNVVASMGTALTETQFKQLTRLTKKLVLALDPDTAGLQSMLRGLDVARATLERDWKDAIFDPRGLVDFKRRLQADIRVAVMPGELDPDEVIHAAPGQWDQLITNARPVIEYVITTLADGYDLSDPNAKAAFSQQVIPMIQDIVDPPEQAYYAQRLASILHIDAFVLQRQIAASKSVARAGRTQSIASPPPSREIVDWEKFCLAELLRAPEGLAEIDEALERVDLPRFDEQDFINPAYRQIFTIIQQVILHSESIEFSDQVRSQLDSVLIPVLDEIEAMPMQPIVSVAGMARQRLPGKQPEAGAVQIALRLRERKIQHRKQELQALIQSADPNDQGLQQYIVETQRAITDTRRKLDRVMRSHEWLQQNSSTY
jgi:DNA primase